MAKKTEDKWTTYTIRYQMPKFGSEGEFLPDLHVFMVCTDKGPDDAKAAFEKYHRGCRLVAILDPLAANVDDRDHSISNVNLAKLEKGKKK